jgi:hypothetical protein
MRVLLISVNRERDPYPVAPLGLGYVAAALRAAHHEPRVLDLCFSDDVQGAIEAAVRDFAPQAVGLGLRNLDNVSMVAPVSYLDDLKAAAALVRGLGVEHVFVGGSGFSLVPEGALEYCGCSLGIVGEGEVALPALCDRLEAGRSLDGVPGLVRRVDGGFVRTPTVRWPWPELPRRPARDLVDGPRYLSLGGMANLQTKRGCAFQCVYCTYPLLEGRGMRLRDVEDLLGEIQALVEEEGADYIFFVDDVFNTPPEYAARICRGILDRRLRFHWTGFVNPRCADEALFALMRQAGCEGVEFGLDVASEAMLRRLGKGFTVAQILEASAACNRVGIPFAHYLLLGGPGESRRTVQETLEVMERADATAVFCAAGMRIYPGTDLHRIALDEGVVQGTDSLLMPTFYCSAEVTGSLLETVRTHARQRDNWIIVGLQDAGMREMLTLAREYDLRGPLWNYLGQFRRRQRRMASRRAGGPDAEPLENGGTAEPRGQVR